MRSLSLQAVLPANDVFFFLILCLAGDDSVDADGLDVTVAVAFAVFASVFASVVVVAASSAASVVAVVIVLVALFWDGVLPFTDYSRSCLPGEAVAVVAAEGLVVF